MKNISKCWKKNSLFISFIKISTVSPKVLLFTVKITNIFVERKIVAMLQ